MKNEAAALLSDLWKRTQKAVFKANTSTQWPQVNIVNVKYGVYELSPLSSSNKNIASFEWNNMMKKSKTVNIQSETKININIRQIELFQSFIDKYIKMQH